MKQLKVLCWMDFSLAGTGFGVVAKNILRALHNTGRYEIHHLAINYTGDFYSKNDVPWQVQPSRLLDPNDPHGVKMFIKALQKNHYDMVFVCNDLYVTNEAVEATSKTKEAYAGACRKPPVFIYYYPVDCCVRKDSCGFLQACDVPVCYTDHGREETLKTCPDLKSRLRQIPHGVDTGFFHPVHRSECNDLKKQYFKVDPETKVVINVNRNSTRKQMQYSMLAFSEYRKQVPNSMMYLHTAVRDQGGDLLSVIEDLGMDYRKDIVFPVKFSPANPAPVEVLNQLYNASDLFLTTHLGEGYGLSQVEAMACGPPVVAPDNTCVSELLGKNSERGYMYECKDTIWIDRSGPRKKGLIPDIVEQMVLATNEGKENNPKVNNALRWTKENTWTEMCKRWVALFRELEHFDNFNKATDTIGEIV